MSGQLEMCASSSVFAVLRSFYSLILLQLHLALRQYFTSFIAFFFFFMNRRTSDRIQTKQKHNALQFYIIV